MNQITIFVVIAGVFSVLLQTNSILAAAINCPTDGYEANPNIRQLCYAIEQVVSGGKGALVEDYGLDRSGNLNTKRQDVDHVFLRFGRRFGL